MRISFVCLLLVVSVHCFAQSTCDCFDRLYNLSNVYYTKGDWPMAIRTLKDGMSFLSSELAGNYYHELGSDYTHVNQDSALLYLAKAIEQGYPISWIKREYPDIYKRMDSVKLERFAFLNYSKIDFSIYDKFISTLATDQFVRNETFFPRKYLIDSTLGFKGFVDTIYKKVDSLTFQFAKAILDKYQFPTESKLGFYPSGFMAVLLHLTAVDDEKSRYIINKLEQLNESCNFPQKSTILFLKDRQRLYKTGKSCCGLVGYNRYQTIDDLTKADSIRFTYNQVRITEELSSGDSSTIKKLKVLEGNGYKPIPYPNNYFCKERYRFK